MKTMRENVVIIGSGRIGQAIAKLLLKKGKKVELWDKDTSKNPKQKALNEIVPEADFLFLCVPSWSLRAAIKSFAGFIKKDTILISLTKGIEADTLKTAPYIIKELVPQNKYALLAGPMLAEELIQGKETRGIVGTEFRIVFSKLKLLFEGSNLKLEWSTDVRGIALAGAVKNIYAVAFGIADCLRWGDNAKGWLLSVAFREMVEIVTTLGGKLTTVLGPSGLGDLVATSFSPYSRNRQTGEELVRKGQCAVPGEGIRSLPAIRKLLGRNNKRDFKLLNLLLAVCLRNEDVKKAFEDLLKDGLN
jgi:glycerol-3-phosphate dehydrogenase (NAD(P)+)